MSSFTQAALDPIFWMHHCNIDRLWEVWIQRKKPNQNPDKSAWLKETFRFHSASGGTVAIAAYYLVRAIGETGVLLHT